MKKEFNLSAAIALLVVSYSMYSGFNIGSSVACFAACSLYGFKLWLDQNKKESLNEAALKRIQYLEDQVGMIKLNTGLRNIGEQKRF